MKKALALTSFQLVSLATASSFASVTRPESQKEVSNLHFGYVKDYSASVHQLIVKNESSENMKVESEISGDGFSKKNHCPEILASGASCALDISYWNINPGYAAGELSIKTGSQTKKLKLAAFGGSDPTEPTTSH